MFECSISGVLLRRLLESLRDVCTDINLECDENGMSMQAMDNSHVALVHLHLPVEFFDKYRCDRATILGINVPHMLKILNIVKEHSEVFLSKYDDEDEDVDSLRISIYDNESFDASGDDESKRAETLTVDLKMVDMEKEHLDIPESNHTSTCTMKAKKFQEIVKYLSTVGESMNISIEKQYLILQAQGDSIKIKKQFKNMFNDVIVTSTEPISQQFATRYLVMFARASSIAESVSLGLSADTPLSLRFSINSKSNGLLDMDMDDSAALVFFLAPKLDED